MYWIGYDVGSSSVKVSLVEAGSGKVLGITQQPEKEMPITSLKPGWAEQDPEMWWDNLCRATAKLVKQTHTDPKKIKGIGISYQMHGLVLVDSEHRVLRDSIIWCDSRAVEAGAGLLQKTGEDKCLERLLNIPGNFTLSKLKWVKDNEPEIYEKVYKFLLPGDYIALKLTGKCTTTPSGLSEGIIWDFKDDKPAVWLLEEAGIDTSLLPDIVPAFSEQGALTAEAAEELGLKKGTPLLYRAGDQPNNALSLNVFGPGEIAATGGTSGVVYAVSNVTSTTEGARINNFAHVNHKPGAPRIGKLLNINGAGILYRWMKEQVGGGELSYDEMNRMAATVPVGASGLCILPFGNGAERMLGNKNMGAGIFNLNFNIHREEHLYRAALESIAFSFVYGIGILENDGVELTTIKAGGDNLFRSELFSRTIATLTGREIAVVNTTGAVGAARAAGYSYGDFEIFGSTFSGDEYITTYTPLEEKKAYQDAYASWKEELVKTQK
ncbi:xylulokinase [Sinomicrobium weinanense]|uniref:Carbohydrate kinase n=1 Tax=Sinomicrobium weinanense TaxID=2842200 RepID=A0A926JU39_9FLAO|nr:FGGY family carbohydrate kinase [Sinomicrobium weinanense]MBC9797404.1 carbohydrate kinase [Sinomicrobium weinanense]MBU3124559.1 carbohydrate kinase [Sinomicrobium weinanense]